MAINTAGFDEPPSLRIIDDEDELPRLHESIRSRPYSEISAAKFARSTLGDAISDSGDLLHPLPVLAPPSRGPGGRRAPEDDLPPLLGHILNLLMSGRPLPTALIREDPLREEESMHPSFRHFRTDQRIWTGWFLDCQIALIKDYLENDIEACRLDVTSIVALLRHIHGNSGKLDRILAHALHIEPEMISWWEIETQTSIYNVQAIFHRPQTSADSQETIREAFRGLCTLRIDDNSSTLKILGEKQSIKGPQCLNTEKISTKELHEIMARELRRHWDVKKEDISSRMLDQILRNPLAMTNVLSASGIRWSVEPSIGKGGIDKLKKAVGKLNLLKRR